MHVTQAVLALNITVANMMTDGNLSWYQTLLLQVMVTCLAINCHSNSG